MVCRAKQLEELADVGITLLEIMPVAEFHGRFGWGYDGVDLFAPTRLYGVPDDFRAFIDRAHALGIGVILDVVYNHVGIEGNVLHRFSESYFSKRYDTDWGRAINFDDQDSGPVREFYLANAAYWIKEFHLDGFRLDATQNIYDESDEHILAAATRRSSPSAGGRSTIIVAENELQDVGLVQPRERGGMGMDALWNDDFHHSAMVVLYRRITRPTTATIWGSRRSSSRRSNTVICIKGSFAIGRSIAGVNPRAACLPRRLCISCRITTRSPIQDVAGVATA